MLRYRTGSILNAAHLLCILWRESVGIVVAHVWLQCADSWVWCVVFIDNNNFFLNNKIAERILLWFFFLRSFRCCGVCFELWAIHRHRIKVENVAVCLRRRKWRGNCWLFSKNLLFSWDAIRRQCLFILNGQQLNSAVSIFTKDVLGWWMRPYNSNRTNGCLRSISKRFINTNVWEVAKV